MTSKAMPDDVYTELDEFIDAIPDEKLVLFEMFFERVSNLFEGVSPREREMVLFAYIIGATDWKHGLHPGYEHQGGIGD